MHSGLWRMERRKFNSRTHEPQTNRSPEGVFTEKWIRFVFFQDGTQSGWNLDLSRNPFRCRISYLSRQSSSLGNNHHIDSFWNTERTFGSLMCFLFIGRTIRYNGLHREEYVRRQLNIAQACKAARHHVRAVLEERCKRMLLAAL